jgi:hypothetical protein
LLPRKSLRREGHEYEPWQFVKIHRTVGD